MPTQEKIESVEELRGRLSGAKTVLLTEYRGLMPNPKLGTVTFDVGRAVREAKAGKVEFRVDKAGNIHVPVGKRSFSADKLAANAMALIEAIVRAKPAAAKGTYLRTLTVSSTMSPGVKIDAQGVANLFKKTAV